MRHSSPSKALKVTNRLPMHITRCSFVLWLSLTAGMATAEEIRPDFVTDHDPDIRPPASVIVFPERLKRLWLEALARPEADMQRMTAEAIVRAHAKGMKDLEEAIPRLAQILTATDSHPAARLAAAQALVALHAKEAAPQMAESASTFGADVRQLVEPALADWRYEPMHAVWLARLQSAKTPRRNLILALRSLTKAGSPSDVVELLKIVHDQFRTADVRIEAASAAGMLQTEGLEADANQLLNSPEGTGMVNRLCAMRLLVKHTSSKAQVLLEDEAVDTEPAVAVIALTRLLEISPKRVLPLVKRLLTNADPKIRKCGVDACVSSPTPERIVMLAGLLDDPHPAVRRAVCQSLYDLAKRAEFDGPVRQAATDILSGEKWRGLEQAALLLGALDHKPAAGRLVQLLDFARIEVGFAAAWGLKKLALPETLPAMLDKATRQTEIRLKPVRVPAGLDEQTAQLCEAFGQMKYAPAESLLAQYIPKNDAMGVHSRTAAIWSLGMLHEGIPDEALAQKLYARATDDSPSPPMELGPVREMSAITIGRMKAVSQAAALRQYIGSMIPASRLGMAIRWALIELTGEPISVPDAVPIKSTGWFLEPIEE